MSSAPPITILPLKLKPKTHIHQWKVKSLSTFIHLPLLAWQKYDALLDYLVGRKPNKPALVGEMTE